MTAQGPNSQVQAKVERQLGRQAGGHRPKQSATDANQHSRRVQFTARLTFGSIGTAEATRIEADFTGTDGQLATFSGQVVG